jgi:hypothetical protein
MKSLDQSSLRKSCTTFAKAFTHKKSRDVDLDDFFSDLKVLQLTLPDALMSALEILQFCYRCKLLSKCISCLSDPLDNTCDYSLS